MLRSLRRKGALFAMGVLLVMSVATPCVAKAGDAISPKSYETVRYPLASTSNGQLTATPHLWLSSGSLYLQGDWVMTTQFG